MPIQPAPLWVGLVPPDEPGVSALLAELSDTLMQITGDSGAQSFAIEELRAPGVCLAVAKHQTGELVGCGVLRPMGVEAAQAEGAAVELKRMYARAGTRGVGRTLLAFLESEARVRGYRVILLSTRRVNQRAVNFYTQHAYRPCAPWGRYVGRGASVCMEKYVYP